MREILFKAKRLDNGEWVEGYYVCTLDGKKHYILTGRKTILSGFSHFDNYEVDPETVCQYTGRKDKNGKKIFESDIVKGKFHGYEEKDTITWSERVARFVFPLWDRDEYEVIGNLFDNPDLLTTSSTVSD